MNRLARRQAWSPSSWRVSQHRYVAHSCARSASSRRDVSAFEDREQMRKRCGEFGFSSRRINSARSQRGDRLISAGRAVPTHCAAIIIPVRPHGRSPCRRRCTASQGRVCRLSSPAEGWSGRRRRPAGACRTFWEGCRPTSCPKVLMNEKSTIPVSNPILDGLVRDRARVNQDGDG